LTTPLTARAQAAGSEAIVQATGSEASLQTARSDAIVQMVQNAAQAIGLLGGTGPVLALVSGGRDSVCLLHVTVSICGAGAVRAIHVNYGLRGEDSEADERHCAALCERLGVAIERIPAHRAEVGSGNMQAWAREVRYEVATRLARKLDGEIRGTERGASPGARTRIATGHTASDQVETILYRLAASPGRRALLGMPSREGRLIRPLLGITREQTTAYCRACGLSWREDRSNDSEQFARARVRHGLVRTLRAVHPAAEANVLRTAALLREETELLDGLVNDELAGRHEIAIARLAELPAALQRLIVIRLAEQATGRFVPQAGERVAEILELAAQAGGRGRTELHVGSLAGAVVEGGVLRMIKLPARD
jgi:tRNA(Ile)-lysidine synthase